MLMFEEGFSYTIDILFLNSNIILHFFSGYNTKTVKRLNG